MGLEDNLSEQQLLNRWNDDTTNTMQAYVAKKPLLNDGANTAGTKYISAFGGTWSGTFAGTFLLPADMVGMGNIGTFGTKAGTFEFTPASGWIYVLHGLSFSAVDPAADSGTLGTITLTGLRIDGANLGTLGPIANCTTLYGEDITLANKLEVGWRVNLSGTALGTEGTWNVNVNFSGYKFPSVD